MADTCHAPDPQERDKLLVLFAADVAWRRLVRGVLLNHSESVALSTEHVIEGACGTGSRSPS